MRYTLFFDGCSKGNPGRAGAGFILYCGEKVITKKAFFVGVRETNNVAEYMGMIHGMREASKFTKDLVVKGDSQLIIRQMTGKYSVKHPRMLELYEEAKSLEKDFEHVEYEHILRGLNKEADLLSNMGLLER
jgi:ribonuclease HI